MTRTINKIFGYGFFAVGALKVILLVLILTQFTSNVADIFSGVEIDGNYNNNFYVLISTGVGIAEWLLILGSIVMIFVNTNNQPETIKGYLIGLAAAAIEIIMPNIFVFYKIFVVAGMYMKAGSSINRNCSSYNYVQKISRKKIKDTNWFYEDNKEQEVIKEIRKDAIEQIESKANLETNNKTFDKEEMSESIGKGYIIGAGVIVGVLVLVIVGIVVKEAIRKKNLKPNVDIVETQTGISGESHVEENEEIIDYNSIYEANKNKNDQDGNAELVKIKDTFNNCNSVKELRTEGISVDAMVVENKIKVVCNLSNFVFHTEFVKDNNILIAEIANDGSFPEKSVIELTLALVLVDCIGQTKGYPEDATLNALNALNENQLLNCTTDNEGIEFKKLDNGQRILLKVDLNSNFQFINF